MSTGAIIAIVIAIVIIAAAAVLAVVEMRRRALRNRFGAEYDRLVKEKGSRQAEAELTERQRRFAKLDIHELTAEQRAGYAQQWTAVQERFVDDPAGAVRQAGELITSVEQARGYPADDLDTLTIEHAQAVEGYREAKQMTSGESDASTEQLRSALLAYRSLFSELTGSPDETVDSSRTPVGITADNRPADGQPSSDVSASSTQTPKE